MIRRVSRRVHGFESPPRSRRYVARADATVRCKIPGAALLDLGRRLVEPRRMRPEAGDRRAAAALQWPREGRMIDMGMRHQDVRNRLAGKRLSERVQMLVERRTGIDHRDGAAP